MKRRSFLQAAFAAVVLPAFLRAQRPSLPAMANEPTGFSVGAFDHILKQNYKR